VNANGSFSVSNGCLDVYGANATVTIPSSGVTACNFGLSVTNTVYVSGGTLTVNGQMFFGVHGGGHQTDVVFNCPVVVNGVIKLFAGSTVTFNGGISGNYTYEYH